MLAHLSKIANIKVNFLVYYTQALPHIVLKRVQLLIPQPAEGTQVLVITRKQVHHTIGEEAQKQTILTAGIAQNIYNTNSSENTPSELDESLSTDSEMPPLVPIPYSEIMEVERRTTDHNMPPGISNGPYCYNTFGIFTWSRTIQIPCYKANDVLQFHVHLKEAMRRLDIGQSRAKKVQRFAWPHAASGGSMCITGNEGIGKTWSYLPTLCQRVILETPPRINDSRDFGPSCIIVCNDKEGNDIVELCMKLLGTTSLNFKQVVKAFRLDSIAETVSSLNKPCGILITNIDCLAKLYVLNGKKFIFKPDALKCVAFDGIDRIWREGKTHCQNIIYWLLTNLSFRKGHSQLFVVGRLWIDLFMKPLMREMPDILLEFEDALEAAMFAGINFEFLVSNNYNSEILKILAEKKLMKKRAVLACSEDIVVSEVIKLLNDMRIDNLVIENFDPETEQLYDDWCNNHMCRVLVVTENAIDKLHGGCIDFLVHYGYSSWPHFKAQFSIFYNNYLNGIEKFNGISVIVMHSNSFEQPWYLCDLLLKHNRHPPESFLIIVNQFRKDVDLFDPPSDLPLCRMFKSYGNCIRRSCEYRHFMWDYETKLQGGAPSKGTIQFYVISVSGQ